MRALANFLLGIGLKSATGRVAASDRITAPVSSSLDQDPSTALINAAGTAVAAGRFTEALADIDRALERSPENAQLHFARGSTLFSWGRYTEACAALDAARQHGLCSSALFTQRGWALYWVGRIDDAATSMRHAVAAQPEDWAAHFGLASILRVQKRNDESLVSSMRALELNPDEFFCLANVVACQVDCGNLDAAEAHARRAIEMYPESALAWSNLGGVLDHQDRRDAAREAYKRADELESASPDPADEYLNYVICLINSAESREASAVLETKLARDPDARAQSHYALALLTLGRFREGWPQYEFRWMKEPLSAWRPRFVKPPWTGQDIRGKTILLRTEQGHGDFIQFIRYAPLVKALGARVLLEVRDEMRGLAQSVLGIDEIVPPGSPYPAFDLYVNLLSLPRAFDTDFASIPAAVPYLRVRADRAQKWTSRIVRDGSLNVGLTWAGLPNHPRDRFRSLPLARLAALARVRGVRFYFLQKGAAAAEASTPPDGMQYVDLGPELQDFDDTAAVIDQLDLVIGVDTSVIHLAGALGKPVWVMIPKPADWRWLEDRTDTPWYPTMRLFRQECQGEWAPVIDQLVAALAACVAMQSPTKQIGPAPAVAGSTLTSRSVGSPMRVLSEVVETRAGFMQYFPNDGITGKSLARYGEFLQQHIDILARFGLTDTTVLEAGAGVGAHSLPLARAIGPTGHLFLYESDARRKRVLQQNLASNGMTNVTVMRRALDTASSERETIDELLLAKLHWLKISEDIDPSEVIAGAVETLWRLRPNLFIAVHNRAVLEEQAAVVRDFGYACWCIQTPLFNASNFHLRDSDVFDGRLALALLALPEELSIDAPIDGCERLR